MVGTASAFRPGPAPRPGSAATPQSGGGGHDAGALRACVARHHNERREPKLRCGIRSSERSRGSLSTQSRRSPASRSCAGSYGPLAYRWSHKDKSVWSGPLRRRPCDAEGDRMSGVPGGQELLFFLRPKKPSAPFIRDPATDTSARGQVISVSSTPGAKSRALTSG